jgi:2-aminoadipate transaminase
MPDPQTLPGYSKLFVSGLPAPSPRFVGMPKYALNAGHNDPALVPIEALAEAASSVIRREGRKLAVYNLSEGPLGYSELRTFFSDKLKLRGIDAPPDEILVTSGSGQGIDLIMRLLVAPGDTILFEEVSYQAAINKARSVGARIVPVPVDEDGLRADALATILADLQAQGITPKFIYTIPTVQNPTGTIMPLERRHEIIRVARQYGVPIFEDECYADIVWKAGTPPALYGLAPQDVIHIGTLSKTLAPALRVAYLTAPWPVLSQIVALKNDGGTGALDQMVAAEYFSGHFEAHLQYLSARLQQKCEVMLEALRREFGTSADIWEPAGGIFVWVRLNGDIDMRRLVEAAAAHGLSFNPGSDWAIDGDASANHFRLCFGLPTEQEIEEGIAVLARLCHEHAGIPPRGANTVRRGVAA